MTATQARTTMLAPLINNTPLSRLGMKDMVPTQEIATVQIRDGPQNPVETSTG